MPRRTAFLFSLTLMLCALMLRVAPYAGRLPQTVTAPASGPVRQETADGHGTRTPFGPWTVSSRLGDRPAVLVAAGLALEALLLGALLYVVLRSPWGGTFNALSRPYQVFAAGLVSLLMLGFIGGSAATFPFMPWRMYAGGRPGDPVIHAFVGTDENGRAIRLDVSSVLRGFGHVRAYDILIDQAGAVEATTLKPERAAARRRLDATLSVLGRIYNREHTAAPLRRIACQQASVSLDTPPADVWASAHTIADVAIDAAPRGDHEPRRPTN